MAGVGTSRNYVRVFDFRVVVKLDSEHVDFPKDFYEARKKELGNRVELHDPKGNILRLPLFYGPKVLLWESTQELVQFYGLNKNHIIYFSYEKENKFFIEIWDEKFEEIVYPDRVEEVNNESVVGVGEEPQQESIDVIVVSSDSEEDEDVEDSDFFFEAVMTKTQCSGKQTLCLPKRFVDGFLKREWDSLRLLVEGGGEYVCKLLWSTRNLSECNLGKDWYKFVEDMDVDRKDKVQFRGGSRDVNVVNVRVIRRWQY